MSVKPVIHGRDHLPTGADPITDFLLSPTWEDISGGVSVSRVTPTDTDPTYSVSWARRILIGGLAIIRLKVVIGSTVGSGISAYKIDGLGNQSLSGVGVSGTGIFYKSGAGQPLYRASILTGSTANEVHVLWDGSSAYGVPVGPAASTGGGPYDFVNNTTLFEGVIILELPT